MALTLETGVGVRTEQHVVVLVLSVVWARVWTAQNILVTRIDQLSPLMLGAASFSHCSLARHVTPCNGGSWSWHEWARTLKTHFTGVNIWWDYWTFIFNLNREYVCDKIAQICLAILWEVLETLLLLMQQGRCQQWIEQKLYKSYSSVLFKRKYNHCTLCREWQKWDRSRRKPIFRLYSSCSNVMEYRHFYEEACIFGRMYRFRLYSAKRWSD